MPPSSSFFIIPDEAQLCADMYTGAFCSEKETGPGESRSVLWETGDKALMARVVGMSIGGASRSEEHQFPPLSMPGAQAVVRLSPEERHKQCADYFRVVRDGCSATWVYLEQTSHYHLSCTSSDCQGSERNRSSKGEGLNLA